MNRRTHNRTIAMRWAMAQLHHGRLHRTPSADRFCFRPRPGFHPGNAAVFTEVAQRVHQRVACRANTYGALSRREHEKGTT